MDSNQQLIDFPSTEPFSYDLGLDWLLYEDPYFMMQEFPPLLDQNMYDFNNLYHHTMIPYQNSYSTLDQFTDIDDLFVNYNLHFDYTLQSSLYENKTADIWPTTAVPVVVPAPDPPMVVKPPSFQKFEAFGSFSNQNMKSRAEFVQMDRNFINESCMGRKRRSSLSYTSSSACNLEMEEIQKYFDMPITMAAQKMNVGLTLLKKRCRELNIMRWPHRKIKSLKSLIKNAKELGFTNELKMLEEQEKLLEIIPDMELTERTKKLRQTCFKDNYKRRRLNSECYFEK